MLANHLISSTILLMSLMWSATAIGVDNTPGADFLKAYPEALALQADFGVGGKHGSGHPELWLKGAGQIISQLNKLIDFMSPGFVMESLSVEEGHEYYKMQENQKLVTLLEYNLNKFKSDKAVFYQHYHHVYAQIIEDLGGRMKPLRYLEIGMGTNKTNLVSTMGRRGRPGASLRAFSAYLPNSEIFGADVDRDIIFQDEESRIRTTYIDGFNISTYNDLYDTFGSKKFDFIIDDAAHAVASDLNTFLFALEHVNVPGYIVIEDISFINFNSYRVIDFICKARTNDEVVIKSHMVFTAHRRHGEKNPDPKTKSYIYVVSVQKKKQLR